MSAAIDAKRRTTEASNKEMVNAKSIGKMESTVQTPKSLTNLPDLSDIDGLVDFIHGNKPIDKTAHKAAKKARQKMKKEEERLKKEAEEEARKQEDERLKETKRREEELIKAQALSRQQGSQLKKNRKNKQQAKNEENPKSNEKLMEETIPAMVTIKRLVENNNSQPTVTITLKGLTPDQDNLLCMLINGHGSDYTDAESKANGNDNNLKKSKHQEQAKKRNEINSDSKKKQKKESNTSKELQVTLAVEKSFHKGRGTVDTTKNKNKNSQKRNETNKSKSHTSPEIDISSLKLPPSITLTKVIDPLTNKNCKSTPQTSTTATQYQNVPKKSRKKKNKNKQKSHENDIENSTSAMVTLKNPIFHTLRTKLVEKSNIPLVPYNEAASITKGENGMVIIRRPTSLPVEKESSMSNFLSDLKPVIGTEMGNSSRMESTNRHRQSNNSIYNDASSYVHSSADINKTGLSAQDILWGLPDIEIIKVNKNAKTADSDIKKSCQTADVSIISTSDSSNCEKFNVDDWPFGSNKSSKVTKLKKNRRC